MGAVLADEREPDCFLAQDTAGRLMRKYFITGLLVWIPIAVTVWMLHLVIATLDQTLLLLPERYQTKNLLGFYIPGLGVILTLVVIFVTGLLTGNFAGKAVLRFWEGILRHIPVISSLYSSVKQVSDTLLSSDGNAFRKAVMIPYPRAGSWTIAFLTGVPGDEVSGHLEEGEHVSLFVPTTPNPTSGFFLIMPKKDVIELNMSVDTALKYIVSMGTITPKPDGTGK